MKLLCSSLLKAYVLAATILIVGTLSINCPALHALPIEAQTPVISSPDKSSELKDFGNTNSVEKIIFGPEDLVATLTRKEIKVWRARSSQSVCTISLPSDFWFSPNFESNQILAFSPSGDRFAFVMQSRLIHIYETQSGKLLLTLGGGLLQAQEERRTKIAQLGGGDNYSRPIDSVAFSADGTRLFSSGSSDEPPRVWNPETGEMLRALDAPRIFAPTQIAVSPDSRTFAVFAPNTMIVFDSVTGLENFRLKGSSFEGDFYTASFADGGKTLVSVGYAGAVKTYDGGTGKLVTLFYLGSQGYRARIWAISDQGRRLSTIWDSRVKIRGFSRMVLETWDIQSQKKLSRLVFPADQVFGNKYPVFNSPKSWDISQDGTLVVTSPRGEKSYVWQRTNGMAELENSLPPDAEIQKVKAYLQSEEGQKLR